VSTSRRVVARGRRLVGGALGATTVWARWVSCMSGVFPVLETNAPNFAPYDPARGQEPSGVTHLVHRPDETETGVRRRRHDWSNSQDLWMRILIRWLRS
jgi:hypothetical protein